ncbi:ShiA-like protein [Shigella flexneri]|nr:ShiA-like protein [Shigella flexneri]
MNDRLCFEVHDNKGYFVFPDTWFGPLLGEFEEVLDAYDADEISETSYINKLRRLAQREPDFIDIHAHLAYAFLGNDSNLLIVFYVQIMPDDFVMQLHRF